MPTQEYSVHESSYVDEPSIIGASTKIWHFFHIMNNCRIGAKCNIGQNVVIPPNVMVGNNEVIEDVAQAIGAEYKGTARAASATWTASVSSPGKNLGGYGYGGTVTANDPALFERLAAFRVHGCKRKYVHEWVGVNPRLDALQAAVPRVKFRYLDQWTLARHRNADNYRTEIAQLGVPVTAPVTTAYQARHVYNQFSIRCPNVTNCEFFSRSVGSALRCTILCHYISRCVSPNWDIKRATFPVSEKLAREALSLSANREVSSEEIKYICGSIRSFYAH